MTYFPPAPWRFSVSVMPDNVMLIGESFAGEGAGATYVNMVLGRRAGSVRGGLRLCQAAADGIVIEAETGELPLIPAVWLNPAATVSTSHRAENLALLRAGVAGEPSIAAMLRTRDHPVNQYFGPAIAAAAGP